MLLLLDSLWCNSILSVGWYVPVVHSGLKVRHWKTKELCVRGLDWLHDGPCFREIGEGAASIAKTCSFSPDYQRALSIVLTARPEPPGSAPLLKFQVSLFCVLTITSYPHSYFHGTGYLSPPKPPISGLPCSSKLFSSGPLLESLNLKTISHAH